MQPQVGCEECATDIVTITSRESNLPTQLFRTMFYYVIQTNYGYGWEDESTYEVGTKYAQVRHDADEYQLMGAKVRINRREPKIIYGRTIVYK